MWWIQDGDEKYKHSAFLFAMAQFKKRAKSTEQMEGSSAEFKINKMFLMRHEHGAAIGQVIF